VKKIGLYPLWVFQYVIVLAFWLWDNVDNHNGNPLTQNIGTLLVSVGKLAALLAVLGILLQLILIGRVKWVERVFGLDRLTRVHHFNGITIVLLLIGHPLLVGMGYGIQFNVSLGSQLVDFILHWEDVLAAAIGLLIILTVGVFSVGMIRNRLKYETWYFVHLGLYLAVILAIGHQFSIGGDFTANRGFFVYWLALYLFAAGNLIFFRFLLTAVHYYRQRFTIERLVSETADTTSVYIQGKNLSRFPIEAGQFMIVRFMVKGFWPQAHPFSMSSMPDGKQIRLSIKNVGDFTSQITNLKPGTPVLIDGPHGVFTAQKCTRDKVLMIAGGIGITPIRSLAEELIKSGKDVFLLYSNRTANSIVFEKELLTLASANPNLHVIHIITNDPAWKGETGRLDRSKIEKLVPDLPEREIYLCGPPPMMTAIISALKKIRIPKARIHYEKFSL
jgi:predicted ferric reductase